MLPSESYPSLSSSSSSPLSYSVRFQNYFRSMVSGLERESSPSSSFQPSTDFFENSLHSIVYSYLLSSADFRKNPLHLVFPLPYSLLPAHIHTSSNINSALWCPHPSSPIQDLLKFCSVFWCPHPSSPLQSLLETSSALWFPCPSHTI